VDTTKAWSAPSGRRWPWGIVLVVLLVGSELLTCSVSVAKRASPFLIGALTDSWGPTPGIVGMRDGLLALGYHEDEQFVIGVRFTQGDVAALPAAARELVEHGVDLIFAMNDNTAKAAQRATSRIPIVFAGGEIPWVRD
jgi:ABC-type uncharacterized transport system substrate-binding protein